MRAYKLLKPEIQKVIFDMKWPCFRPIQEESIIHLIEQPSDLIISAPTASGKTEAALLPVISEVAENGKSAVKVLYISPLKALINDQFERIEALCRYIKFPITKWHGDASVSRKEKLLENPAGILLITPESIEALLLNKKEYIKKLFQNVSYIVIDEVHSFIGNERGSQLRSLIRRLSNELHIRPIKIALSATISNLSDIAGWLNPENPKSVYLIEDKTNQRETVGVIKYYTKEDNQDMAENLKADLFKATRVGKSLIFANSKNVLETYCSAMKELAEFNGFSNHYYIHHGSLAKNIREKTEQALKKETNIAVFCTNTLELGIDIGNVDRVLFLDAPVSVASMVQKLGRSGRKKGTRREFRFFLSARKEAEIEEKQTNWDDIFRADLIQSMALVELMLTGFSEPLNTNYFDYSTFVHQILSYLGQTGGANASDIYRVIGQEAFNGIFSKADFVEILKELSKEKIVYQLNDGLITLHKKGEQLVENYGFYAAFKTPEMFKVMYNGKEVGEISANKLHFLAIGEQLLLAGRGWKIIEIKEKSKIILVQPARGKANMQFDGGMQAVHSVVHQKMKEIYEKHFVPAYISKQTKPILEEVFRQYDACKDNLNGEVLIVLAGTKVQQTLSLLFRYFQKKARRISVGFIAEEGASELIGFLQELDLKTLDFEPIVHQLSRDSKCFNKFDYLLPESILNKSYIQNHLDIEGVVKYLDELKSV